MTLISTLQAGVETAFAVGAEFVVVGTYRKRTGNPSYDPVADTLADNGNIISNVRYLRTAATREEREASPVTVNDAKFLVPAVDLPSLEPGENDVLTVGGLDYNVLSSKFVPGDAIHIIFGRRA